MTSNIGELNVSHPSPSDSNKSPEQEEARLKASQKLTKKHASFSAARSLVNSASQIQQISGAFFKVLLERVNNIKPSYLVAKIGHRRKTFGKHGSRKHAQGCRYEPLRCSSASWIEQQRVCRALWCLQIYLDLVAILEPVKTRFPQVWDLLKKDGPYAIWPKTSKFVFAEEIQCVYEFMCEFADDGSPSSIHPRHISKFPTLQPQAITSLQKRPNTDWDLLEALEQNPRLINAPAAAIIRISAQLGRWYSPLYECNFEPFRRLGFSIWDGQKLLRLGLTRLPDKRLTPDQVKENTPTPALALAPGGLVNEDDHLFRWYSLVGDVDSDFTKPQA